jgi:hypothetical protein
MGDRSFHQNEASRCRRRASRALSPESNHRREGISARINPGQNGAFNKFEDAREVRADVRFNKASQCRLICASRTTFESIEDVHIVCALVERDDTSSLPKSQRAR